MTSVAWPPAVPFFGENMFDASGAQNRAEPCGIQKSPIKSKKKSTKARLSALKCATHLAQQAAESPLTPKSPPAESPHSPKSPASEETICIQGGFCKNLDAAARSGHLVTIDRCIQLGANINQKTVLSLQTPLHASLQLNQREAMSLLVTKGADIYEVFPNSLPALFAPPTPFSTPR